MRKIIFEIAVSIDGFIEGPNGEMDWLRCDEEVNYTSEMIERFDTIFYGRVTYERFGIERPVDEYLPERERDFNRTVNAMRKYVFSRKLKHMPGNGMMVNGNMLSEIRRLKDEEDGKDIWFCGGADLLTSFLDHDLIDEYVLAVQPVVLGSGKPLFKSLKKRLNLQLIRTENLPSGVVLLNYKPESRTNKNITHGRSI